MPKTLSPMTKHLTRAKLTARSWCPYLSHIFNTMQAFSEPSINSMAVDQECRLYVNEEWLVKAKREEVAYTLIHEVMHVVLAHFKRAKATLPPTPTKQDMFIWNVAADLCIQQVLQRQLHMYEPEHIVSIHGKLPLLGVDTLDIVAANCSCENYYWTLKKHYENYANKPKCSGGNASPQQHNNGDDDEDDSDSQSQSQPQSQPQQQDDDEKGDDSDTGGDSGSEFDDITRGSGSGADGQPREYERPSRPTGNAALRQKLTETRRIVKELVDSRPGSVPGDIVTALDVTLAPAGCPFDELRSVVARSVATPVGTPEHSYRRLSRRQPVNGARIRGVVYHQPECSIILDTSGSMDYCNVKDRAIATVAQGVQKVKQPRVICFDAKLQSSKKITSMKGFKWEGGGGTDMALAIEEEDKEHRPDAIVVITDGETDWPREKPRARVVIALCIPAVYPTPPWAKVIHCYRKAATYHA